MRPGVLVEGVQVTTTAACHELGDEPELQQVLRMIWRSISDPPINLGPDLMPKPNVFRPILLLDLLDAVERASMNSTLVVSI